MEKLCELVDDLEKLKEAVFSDDFDVNFQDENGFSLLHVAAQADNPAAIRILLSKDVTNPNLKLANGNTPLMLSCSEGNIQAFEALLESKEVDLSARNKEYRNVENLVKDAKGVGDDTKNKMRMLIENHKSRGQEAKTDGRHAVLVTNVNYKKTSDWGVLEGCAKDRDYLKRMFTANHYTVHEINDAEDLVSSLYTTFDKIERSSVKLMHFAYAGS